MKPKFAIIIFILCLISPGLSASTLGADRLRPHFFAGELNISPVPLVGQQATISLELAAMAGDCEDATIQFKTPAGIQPLGYGVFSHQSFTRGSYRSYFLDVLVLAEGNYALQASVYFQSPEGQRKAEHFFIYLLAGKTYSQIKADTSFLSPTRDSRMKSPVPPDFTQSPVGGMLSVQGYITYYDDNLSMSVPIRGVAVELLERNGQESEQIDRAYTDADGFYSFQNVENVDPEDNTGRDIQLRALFENDVLEITDTAGILYHFDTFVAYNVSNGEMEIHYSLDSRNQHRGLGHMFNCVTDVYDFLQERVGWRRNKITVKWPHGEHPAYQYSYHGFGNIKAEHIQVPAGMEWNRGMMLHEYGHAVMTGMYGYNHYFIPRSTFQDEHSIHTVSDTGFAMKEGWAEFFEALIDDKAFNLKAYANTDTPNIESNDWWTGAPNGDGSNTQGELVEGAVASIFWDIADTDQSHDGSPGVDDDGLDGMFEELWNVMLRSKPRTISRLWDRWVQNEYPQAQSLYLVYVDHGIEVEPPPAPELDVTAPVITSTLSIPELSETSVLVVWSTDEVSDSVVEYGEAPEYGLAAKGSEDVVEHSVPVNSLSPDTIYYYRAGSTDASGNTVWSEGGTFKTMIPPASSTLSLASIDAAPGEHATVLLSAIEAIGMAGADILIEYDTDLISEVSEVRSGNLIPDTNLIVNNNVPGEIRIGLARAQGITSGSGVLVEIELTIHGDAEVGTEGMLEFGHTRIYDESGMTIPVNLENGVVRIIESVGIKGDVNNDGEIHANDAIIALRIAAKLVEPSDYEKWAADMNGDHSVMANDAILILYKATGLAAPGIPAVPGMGGQYTITMAEAHGVSGGNITVPLMVDNIKGLAGGDISVCYDKAVLRAVGVSSDPGVILASSVIEPGVVRIAFATVNAFSNHRIAEIQFHVLADDISPLKIGKAELYGFDASPLNSSVAENRFISWATSPEQSALMQNFPNPFNPETWIPYKLKEANEVTIRVYSLTGSPVRQLNLGYKPVGLYINRDRAAYWDGRNQQGEEVSSGVYFYSIEAGDFSSVRKLTVLH